MICFPNAKINLGLHIVSKRSDGYHNIETIFYPVNICDALEITPAIESKGIFKQTGIEIGGLPEDNLVLKAYHLLKRQYELPEVDIYLRKNIPFGAGLGGGSSDAAFMLKSLNDFAHLNLSHSQLEEFASGLGADCSFFIQNKPAYAEGIGNIFAPIAIDLSSYYLLLVDPGIHVSTKEAYSGVYPKPSDISLVEITKQPVNTWKDNLKNDFEKTVFALYPEIAEIKENLYQTGASYASMSGSGSAVYGIFDKSVDAELERITYNVKRITFL